MEALTNSAVASASVESKVAQADGIALVAVAAADVAGLHDAGMEIEIVRHDGGAEDPHGDEQHLLVGDDLARGNEAAQQGCNVGLRQPHLDAEAHKISARKVMTKASIQRKPRLLHPQDEKDVERGDDDADRQRDAEKQLQADGGADDLGKVGGDDRALGEDPETERNRTRKAEAAGLGKIEPGPEPEPGTERLQENRHDVRDQGDGEQLVAEGRAAGERGRPVSGSI